MDKSFKTVVIALLLVIVLLLVYMLFLGPDALTPVPLPEPTPNGEFIECPNIMTFAPVACNKILLPVCGYSEDSLVVDTFSNDCMACNDGRVNKYKEGACKENPSPVPKNSSIYVEYTITNQSLGPDAPVTKITLSDDGSLVYENKPYGSDAIVFDDGQLGSERLAEVKKMILDADWASYQDEYYCTSSISECLAGGSGSTLVVKYNQKVKTITFDDALVSETGVLPKELKKVYDLMNEFKESFNPGVDYT